jgi:hypothetical protein
MLHAPFIDPDFSRVREAGDTIAVYRGRGRSRSERDTDDGANRKAGTL